MRYVQDPVTLELVPASEYDPQPRAAYVIGDIEPYRSMATGELVGGRRQHREHLKANRLIEVGNEINAHLNPPKPKVNREEIRRTLYQAVQRHIR